MKAISYVFTMFFIIVLFSAFALVMFNIQDFPQAWDYLFILLVGTVPVMPVLFYALIKTVN